MYVAKQTTIYIHIHMHMGCIYEYTLYCDGDVSHQPVLKPEVLHRRTRQQKKAPAHVMMNGSPNVKATFRSETVTSIHGT